MPEIKSIGFGVPLVHYWHALEQDWRWLGPTTGGISFATNRQKTGNKLTIEFTCLLDDFLISPGVNFLLRITEPIDPDGSRKEWTITYAECTEIRKIQKANNVAITEYVFAYNDSDVRVSEESAQAQVS